jgi:hypothetical protein
MKILLLDKSNLGSGIRDQESEIRDQKTENRNIVVIFITGPRSIVSDPWSQIPDLC